MFVKQSVVEQKVYNKQKRKYINLKRKEVMPYSNKPTKKAPPKTKLYSNKPTKKKVTAKKKKDE